MFLRSLVLLSLLPAVAFPARAHDIITTGLTWSEHISRIFYLKCISCHQDGGAAPMPLETYEQVRPWAKAIKQQVLRRKMPPWGAVKGYGYFRNDLSLSEDDITKISSWVEGGAPRGDAADLPDISDYFPDDAPPPSGLTRLAVGGAVTLDEEVTALGIIPEEVPEGGSIEAKIRLPSGLIRHLIWIREYQPLFERQYYFREPVRIRRGSKLIVQPEEATALLLVKE